MFSLYLKLRLKSGFRVLKEIGLFRSLFLIGIAVLAIVALFETESRWALLFAGVLGVTGYHANRKDKAFLKMQRGNPAGFLRKEYLLLATPFILAELLRRNWIGAGGFACYVLLLPYLRTIRLRHSSFRLPFLYRGGMEYIRMLRQSGWMYLLLLFVSVMGVVHDNVRVLKVCMLCWAFIQVVGVLSLPDPLQILRFKDYSTFSRMLWKMNGWNVAVTNVPFFALLLFSAPGMETWIYAASVCVASVLYLQGVGLLRQVCASAFSLAILQALVVLPVFLLSCLYPYLLVPFFVLTGIISYFVSGQLKHIWN